MSFWSRLKQALRPSREKPAGAPSKPASAAAEAAPAFVVPARSVSVLIPALNEEARIAEVVRHVWADAATAEVIVIDDSSIDATAERARAAGAQVVRSSMLGKGASMDDGCRAAAHEVLVYLDGDLAGLQPGLVTALAQPVLAGEADFVKASFGRGGGRVTELTAKPMLKVFFPELARFAQPLGGLIAARRTLLRSLRFEDGYGVDVGLLIDAHRAGARMAEVDIGRIENDSQPLLDLSLMATEVARVIFARAREAGRLHVGQVVAMVESQRQASSSLDYVLTRRRGRSRVLLLDMDGTVTEQRFVLALARATGREQELLALLDQPNSDSATRSQAIAALFRFVPRQQFEQAAHAMPLRDGAIEWVNAMRRAGFMVGLVSDSWFVAAEIVRRRLFADFALAHVLHFEAEVCTGQLHLNPAFLGSEGSEGPALCKRHVVARLRDDRAEPRVAEVWALGDNLNDLAMLRAADRAWVIDPKHPHLARDADAQAVAGFAELMAAVPMPLPAAEPATAPAPAPAPAAATP